MTFVSRNIVKLFADTQLVARQLMESFRTAVVKHSNRLPLLMWLSIATHRVRHPQQQQLHNRTWNLTGSSKSPPPSTWLSFSSSSWPWRHRSPPEAVSGAATTTTTYSRWIVAGGRRPAGDVHSTVTTGRAVPPATVTLDSAALEFPTTASASELRRQRKTTKTS